WRRRARVTRSQPGTCSAGSALAWRRPRAPWPGWGRCRDMGPATAPVRSREAGRAMTPAPVLAGEVAAALRDGGPVVALETTLVSHGFPGRQGLEVALAAEARVRAAGAVPATIGVVDGAVRAGLTEADLERFAAAGESARKAGARDLAACVVQGALGATTVGGTLAVCRAAGIRFLGTGGNGGVNRGFAQTLGIAYDIPPHAPHPQHVRA